TIFIYGGTNSRDGDVHHFENEYYDNWVVKINKFGDIIWENCYGGTNVEEQRDALLTPDGGLITLSRISSGGGDISQFYGDVDNWICKIDSMGNIQWEKTLGNHGHENGLGLSYASDTSFFVLAGVNEDGGIVDCNCHQHDFIGDLDVWLVEMDLNGNILRQLCYGGTGHEFASELTKTVDGFVFAAQTDSKDGDVSGIHGIPNGSSDYWVVKINNDGEIIWQKCLGGSHYEWPSYIAQTQDSGFIVIGNAASLDGDVTGLHGFEGDVDPWFVKLDKDGTLQWNHCFGGYNGQRIMSKHAIAKISDDHFVVMTESMGFITDDVQCDLNPDPYTNNQDAWVFSAKDCSHYQPATPQAPTGPDTLCHTTDSSSVYTLAPAAGAWGYSWQVQPEEAGTLVQDSLTATITWNTAYQGEVQISAASYNDCGQSAFSEVKTTFVYTCVGVEENAARGFGLMVYPNPASTWAQFEYTLPRNATDGSIIITDITGKWIETIVLQSNQGSKLWDTRKLPKGVYLYTLKSVGLSETGKVVISR
ncbi:MAG: T9SS type A sorting domain-containing protein, partial [Bacteroidales bacterium]